MKEFIYNGKSQRLSKVIAEQYPLLSYNQILRLIKDKDVRLDGQKVNDDVIVEAGVTVRCYAKDMTLKTVYIDDNITVVYKPKGIPSEGDASADSIVKETLPSARLCHRLDTNTDGLLLFALHDKAYEEVQRCFLAGDVEKVYSARVNGKIPEDTVYVDYLLKNSDEGRVTIFAEKKAGSQEITTAVKVIGYDGDTTVIEASIHNGKTHQIRAQLAAHGHFILGDSKYGRDDINRKYGCKKQQLTAKKIVFSVKTKSFLYYLNGKDISL